MPAISSIFAGVSAAAALGSTANSIFGESEASSQAGQYADQSSALTDEQVATAKQQREMAQAQWDRYLKAFAPLEDTLVKESQQPARQNAGFLAEMGGINHNYANSGANIRRMMGGAYPGGSGEALATQRSLEMNRIRDIAGAESKWNTDRFTRMLNAAQLGRSLPGSSLTGNSSAMSGLSSAANTYGNLANMYGNLSNQAYSGVGQGLGNLYQMYALQNKNNKPSSSFQWSSPSSQKLANAMYDTPGYGYWD
jgi:hypothetical protein